MRTALVLSAGGMFGAWQAGAWRVLSQRFQPDLIVGASAGALNGWAIASGAAPEEIAASWLDPEVANLIRPRFPRPTIFDPAPLHRAARILMDRYQPAKPFALTLVELPGMRVRIVRGEEMTWRHLAASCSIPAAFPPMRLDGRWYVDGGLMGALPLWVAAELGADRAIALDALPKLPSRVLASGTNLLRKVVGTRRAPEGFPVTLIRPSGVLGGLRDSVYWNRENARRWIEWGERDAAGQPLPTVAAL